MKLKYHLKHGETSWEVHYNDLDGMYYVYKFAVYGQRGVFVDLFESNEVAIDNIHKNL